VKGDYGRRLRANLKPPAGRLREPHLAGGRSAPPMTPIGAARSRNPLPEFIGYLELYCRNTDCPARDVTVKVKEHFGDRPTPPRLVCPACRRPLTMHGVATLNEYEEARRREARINVRVQLYEARELRAGRAGGEGVLIPLELCLDDALPRAEELVS
jgi:hypothetical protein